MAHSRKFLSLVYLRVICLIMRMRQPLVSARRNFYIELDRKIQKFRRKTAILKNIYGRFVCCAHFLENVQNSIFKTTNGFKNINWTATKLENKVRGVKFL